MDANFDLDILSQQLQVGDNLELTILDGDLVPGQKIVIPIASKQKTRYHLVLFFQHHIQSLNLADEEKPVPKCRDLVIDHIEIIDLERGYLATHDKDMVWSNQLVTWREIGRGPDSI